MAGTWDDFAAAPAADPWSEFAPVAGPTKAPGSFMGVPTSLPSPAEAGKRLLGIPEAALALGSRAVAYPLGIAAGLGQTLRQHMPWGDKTVYASQPGTPERQEEEAQRDIEQFREGRKGAENALSFAPRSDTGKEMTGAVGDTLGRVTTPLQWLGDKSGAAGAWLSKQTGAPPAAQERVRGLFEELGPIAATAGVGQLLKGARAAAAARGTTMAANAEEAGTALAAAKKAETVASARGTFGAERANQVRSMEYLVNAEKLGELTPEMTEQIRALRGTPEWTEATQNVARNYLEKFQGEGGRVAAAKKALEEANALDEGALKQQIMSPAEAKAQVMARVKRYVAPGVGTAVGTFIGGPLGGAVGALAGAGTRPMNQALLRMAKHPAVASRIAGALQTIAGNPEATALTPQTAALITALRRSPSAAPWLEFAPAAAEEPP